eukprot:TRINITY_DN651_c0_g1_i4.p1 TRINITY_DN651_c0_g1~~TRINITY_DN651_c0_g1_i4.p1  ORF type:complete len:206 (-),score=33.20 TRINITY_DN651_c0_g1_i4:104-721(-)
MCIRDRYYQKGHCKYGAECSFAHGDPELRQQEEQGFKGMDYMNIQQQPPNYPPQQYDQQYNQSNWEMMPDPNLNHKIAQKQLEFMITSLTELHKNDDQIQQMLRQAEEFLRQDNHQQVTDLVSSILYNENATEPQKISYNDIIAKTHIISQEIMNNEVKVPYPQEMNMFTPQGGPDQNYNMGNNQSQYYDYNMNQYAMQNAYRPR